MYRDLFIDGIRLRGYQLGIAPFLYPDLPMVTFSMMLGGKVGPAFTIYSLLTVFLVVLFFAFSAYHVFKQNKIATLYSVIFSTLILSALLQVERYGLYAFYLLFPSNHGGVVISGIILIWLIILAQTKNLWYIWLIIFFHTTLSAFSDLFFIPQIIAPICVAIFTFTCLKLYKWKFSVTLITILILASSLGKYLLRKLPKHKIVNIPGSKTNTSGYEWADVIKDFTHLIKINLEIFIILAIWLIFSIYIIVYFLPKAIRHFKNQQEISSVNIHFLFISGFGFLSVCATFILPIMLSLWGDIQNIRYILPFYLLPILLLPFFVIWFWQEHQFKPALFLAPVTFIICLIYFFPNQSNGLSPDLARTKLVLPKFSAVEQLLQYAQENNLKYGYGNYWYSRPISTLADYQIHVNEIHPEIRMNNWMNNSNRYYGMPEDTENENWPSYNFIIVNDLDQKRILDYFGEPALRKTFQGEKASLTAFIYNRKEDLALRNFLRKMVHTRSFRKFESKPVLYKDLQTPLPNYKGIDDGEIYPVPAKTGIEIEYDNPLIGDMIEISADANDTLTAQFFDQDNLIGEMEIPTAKGFFLQKRFLFLPQNIQNKPITKIKLMPTGDAAPYVLCHIFIYKDSFE